MIRFAPTITVEPHQHIGHLFCYLATHDYAKENDIPFSVRLDLHPVKVKAIPAKSISDAISLFPADNIWIHTNPILPTNVYRDVFELSNLPLLDILAMSKKEGLERNGKQLEMLTLYSVLWDRRSGVTDLVRDVSMKPIEESERKYYEFMKLPAPRYHYIPMLTYDGDRISGSWYGQCPVSCRLRTEAYKESFQLLNRILDGSKPIDLINSDIETISVDEYVTKEEPIMHGIVKMYPDNEE